MNIEQIIEFARGGGAKAAPKAKAGGGGVVTAVAGALGSGGCGNGTQNGKRGFQKGNKCAGGKRNSAVATASRTHQSHRRTVSKHVKNNTLHTPEGRASVRAAAAAHRELQSARGAQKADRAGARKASAAVASGRASALPAKGTTPPPAKPPAKPPATAPAKATPHPTVKARVEKSLSEASKAKVERATQHLHDLHGTAKAGTLKPTEIHKHVDRIARGATKDELFAAAKAAGVKHDGISTKKALVEHLKGHAHGLKAEPAKPTPKAETPAAKPTEAPKAAPAKAPEPKAKSVEKAKPEPARERPDPGHHPEYITHPNDPDHIRQTNARVQERFQANRTPPAHVGPSRVADGPEGDRQIAATIKHAVEHPEVIDGGTGHSHLIAIHKLRDHVEQTLGDVGAARFDRVLKHASYEDQIETIANSDNRHMSQREIDRSVPGLNETIAYVVPPHEKQDYSHGPRKKDKS